IVYGALRLVANSAVYYPARYPDGLWNLQRDNAATEVWLTARDGVKLNAWWIAAPRARLATVFFHGNAGNLTHRTEHIRAIVAAGILPLLGWRIMRGFDSKAKIGKVRAPLLFVPGDRDEVIPDGLGHDLFAAAPEPKSFWTVKGAGHNNLLEVAGGRYRERLA